MNNRSNSKSKPAFAGGEAKKIGGILDGLFASLGLSRRYHGWLVLQAWPELAGEFIAKRSQAIKFEDGTLVVAVENDALRQELLMQSSELMDKIYQLPHGRAVKEIRFVGGRRGN